MVKVAYMDGNDDSVTTSWFKNGTTPVIGKIPITDTLKFAIPADTVPPLVDTINISVGDKDSAQFFKFLVRSNRIPTWIPWGIPATRTGIPLGFSGVSMR